jgi:SAM-dependent methyltransferase
MTAKIDYERSIDYWSAASAAAKNPDFATGVNPVVPEAAHAYCRSGQLQWFLDAARDVPREADVLDLGCGPAVFALALAPNVRSILGVDCAPAFVEAATKSAASRGLSNARFEVSSIVEFEPQGEYGLVVLGAVLSYVGDDELPLLLRRAFAATQPGGAVYVRTPTAVLRRWSRSGQYPSIYRLPSDYRRAFEDAGFTIERSAADPFYTFGDLFRVYFTLLRWVTLGAASPALVERVFRGITRRRGLFLEGPERVIRRLVLPLPPLRSHQFVLRRPRAPA